MSFDARLGNVLQDVFGVETRLRSYHRGPVGNGQETWFCSLTTPDGDREVVVRRTAGSGPLQWTNRKSEFEALRWLSGKGVPTPAVWHFEPDGGRLERAAIVMERMPGHSLSRMEEAERDRLCLDLGRKIARLHAIDIGGWPGVVPIDRTAASEAQLEYWAGRYVSDALQPVPLLEALLGWLEAELPTRLGGCVPLWGDAALYNALSEDGEITAMLDWELAHAGDPFEDLGAAVWATADLGDPDLVVRGYAEMSGREVTRESLRWFETFAATTRAIMVLRGARSLVEDPSPRPSFMALSHYLLPQLLLQAATAAGWALPAPHELGDVSQAGVSALRPSAVETLGGIAEYVETEVLPTVDDALVRRNLKNTAALLRTTANRFDQEADLLGRSDASDATLLADLEEAGVDTTGGLGPTAARIEVDDAHAAHRPRVRTHLLQAIEDLTPILAPLYRLYGVR